jgi:hypothetical protein
MSLEEEKLAAYERESDRRDEMLRPYLPLNPQLCRRLWSFLYESFAINDIDRLYLTNMIEASVKKNTWMNTWEWYGADSIFQCFELLSRFNFNHYGDRQ